MSSEYYPTGKIGGNPRSEAKMRKSEDVSSMLSEGFTTQLFISLMVCDSSRDT